MKFSWQEIIDKLKVFWEKLGMVQRILLIAGPVAVLAVVLSLTLWASQPQYVILFKDLTNTEAGSITAQLKEMSIPYKLTDRTTILVPSNQVNQVRLDLANAGLPKESTFSFENLDKMRLGETDKDRQLRYMLGLQNELERTIRSMEGISYARVHIVQPESTLFVERQDPATASVTVKTEQGLVLNESQIRSIANLLSHSVKGLDLANISISDTLGNVLSDILGNDIGTITTKQLQYKLEVERKIEANVQTLLGAVYGRSNVLVRANADLNFDSQKVLEEKHGPGATVSSQAVIERTTSSAQDGGIPGESTNIPDYTFVSGGNSEYSSEKSSTTDNYQVDTTQTETVVMPGQIRRLTVSVLADSNTVPESQIDLIRNAAIPAAGIDFTRGDELQVVLLPFDKTAAEAAQADWEEAMRRARLFQYGLIAGAGLALLLLLVLLFLRRRRRQKAEQLALEKGGLMALPEGYADLDPSTLLAGQHRLESEAEMRLAQKKLKSSEDFEREKLNKEIGEFTDKNPEEVAKLIKAWLSVEE